MNRGADPQSSGKRETGPGLSESVLFDLEPDILLTPERNIHASQLDFAQ